MYWLEINYLNKSFKNIPSHIITYDTTASEIKTFLINYKLLFSELNTHFPEGPDYSKIMLYKMLH